MVDKSEELLSAMNCKGATKRSGEGAKAEVAACSINVMLQHLRNCDNSSNEAGVKWHGKLCGTCRHRAVRLGVTLAVMHGNAFLWAITEEVPATFHTLFEAVPAKWV